MPKNTNSASRLYSLFLAAQSGQSNAPTFQVWQAVFKIEEATSHRLLMAVVEELMWVQEEIEILRAHMIKREFTMGVYDSHLEQLQNAIQPLNLANVWSSTSTNHVRPETMGFLALSAEMLPNEEIEISVEDLESINYLVIELESLVGGGELPERLQAIVLHHISLIHKAIDKYPVAGARAFRDASWTATGELLQAKNEIAKDAQKHQELESFQGLPEVEKLEQLWKKVNVVLDAVIKVGTLCELGYTGYTLISKASS